MFSILLFIVIASFFLLAESCANARANSRKLHSLKVSELKAICKSQNLTGYSKLNKAQLITLLV